MGGLPPYRNRARTDDPARDFGKQVEAGIANGQLVDSEELTSASSVEVAHSLGRPYRGAIVVGQSSSGAGARVIAPEEHDACAESVLVAFSTVYTGTVRLWVF